MQQAREFLKRTAIATIKQKNARQAGKRAVFNRQQRHAGLWHNRPKSNTFSGYQIAHYSNQAQDPDITNIDLTLKTILSTTPSILLPRQQLAKNYLIEALQRCAKLANHPKQIHCFISYAWESQTHQQWVNQFAVILRAANIKISLDQDLKLGKSLPQFMKKIVLEDTDYILVIATPGYLQRYQRLTQADIRDPGVKTEVRMLEMLELFNEQRGEKIIPLMLAGDESTSLPHLMRGKLYQDFVHTDAYKAIFELVRNLLAIDSRDEKFLEITQYFSKQLELLKSMPATTAENEIVTLQKAKDAQEQTAIKEDLDQRLQQLLTDSKNSQYGGSAAGEPDADGSKKAEENTHRQESYNQHNDSTEDAKHTTEREFKAEKNTLFSKENILTAGTTVGGALVAAVVYLYKHLNKKVLPEQAKKIEQQEKIINDYIFKLMQAEGNRLGMFDHLDYLYLLSRPTEAEHVQHIEASKMLKKMLEDTLALQKEFSTVVKYLNNIIPVWADNILFNQAIDNLQNKLNAQLNQLNLMLNSNEIIYSLKIQNYASAQKAGDNAVQFLLNVAGLTLPGIAHDALLANLYNLLAKTAAAQGKKTEALDYYESAIKYSQEPGLYSNKASLLVDMARLEGEHKKNIDIMGEYIDQAIQVHQYAVKNSRNYPEKQRQQYAADYAYGLYVLLLARRLGYKDNSTLKDKTDSKLLDMARHQLGERMDPTKSLPYARPNHYVFSGIIALEQGDKKLAIKLFDKALALNPNYLTALYRKGMALRLMGDNHQALEVLTAARLNAESSKNNPDNQFWVKKIDEEIGLLQNHTKNSTYKLW